WARWPPPAPTSTAARRRPRPRRCPSCSATSWPWWSTADPAPARPPPWPTARAPSPGCCGPGRCRGTTSSQSLQQRDLRHLLRRELVPADAALTAPARAPAADDPLGGDDQIELQVVTRHRDAAGLDDLPLVHGRD